MSTHALLNDPRVPAIIAYAYALASLACMVGRLLCHHGLYAASKLCLMPLLLCFLARESHIQGFTIPRFVMPALIAALFGDFFLIFAGEVYLLLGIGSFAFMQIFYLIAFYTTQRGSHSFLRRHPLAILPYVAMWLAVNMALAPKAGTLAAPVVLYSGLLFAMAALALNLVGCLPVGAKRVAFGGLMFCASDGLLALCDVGGLANESARGHGTMHFFVMGTYTLAQWLIVHGIVSGCTMVARRAAGSSFADGTTVATKKSDDNPCEAGR